MLKSSLHFLQPSMVPYAYSTSHQETEAARLHLRPVWVGVEIKGKKKNKGHFVLSLYFLCKIIDNLS